MSSPDHRDRFRILVVDDLAAIHDDFRKILAPAAEPVALHETAAALFGPASAAAPLVSFPLDSALQGQEALHLVERAIAAGQPYPGNFIRKMKAGHDFCLSLWCATSNKNNSRCPAFDRLSAGLVPVSRP